MKPACTMTQPNAQYFTGYVVHIDTHKLCSFIDAKFPLLWDRKDVPIHRGINKMVATLRTTLSYIFSWWWSGVQRVLPKMFISLRWHHNYHDGVSNQQPHHCLLNCLFGRRSQKTSKLRVTGLCAGNSPGTGEFPAQMASNAENASIGWRHHVIRVYTVLL